MIEMLSVFQMNTMHSLQQAFEETQSFSRYHPSKGYSWEFGKDAELLGTSKLMLSLLNAYLPALKIRKLTDKNLSCLQYSGYESKNAHSIDLWICQHEWQISFKVVPCDGSLLCDVITTSFYWHKVGYLPLGTKLPIKRIS